MTYINKDWRDANPDGTGDTSTPTNAAAFEDLERRVGGAAGGNSLLAQGCVGNAIVDDEPAFQAALDAQRTNPVWLQGESKTYQINRPLLLGPNAKLRQCNIRASAAAFAPVDANGAMVMQAQGMAAYTASAATDVFTTTGNHGVPADGIGVVVKGTVPAGVTAGRVYYARDRTATTYKLGTARVLGTGTITSGSNEITDLAVSFGSGTWTAGMSISGTGIPAGTTVTTVGPSPGQMFMSANATQTGFRGLTGVSTAVNLTSNGSGNAYHEVLSLGKLYIDDVFVNGNNVANLNGAGFSLQQQSELYKFRVDNAPGKGLMLNGQQAVFFDFESINCGTALHLEGAYFMYFYGPNMEQCNRAVHVPATQLVFPAGYGAGVCSFVGSHLEMRAGSGRSTSSSVAVDLEGQHSEMVFDTGSISMDTTGPKVFHVHTGAAALSGYDIRSFHCTTGGPDANPVFMQDDDRGHVVDTWGEVDVSIGELKATPQPTSTIYHDPGAHSVLLPGGGYVRFGPQNQTDPKLASKAGTDQTGPQAVWRDSADVDKVSIDPDGKLTTATFRVSSGAGVNRVLTSDAAGGATWQALATGSDVLALPVFKSGKYMFAGVGTGITLGSDEIDRLLFVPVLWAIDREREVDRIGILITVAGGAGSVTRLGLYADDGNMQPGALIADYGTVSTATTGFKELAISEVLLPATYWVGCVAQVAAPQWQRLIPTTWGMLQHDPSVAGIGSYAMVPVAGALPATPSLSYPGNLRTDPPAVMFRMV